MTNKKKLIPLIIAILMLISGITIIGISHSYYVKNIANEVLSGTIEGTLADFRIEKIYVDNTEVQSMSAVPSNYIIDTESTYCYTSNPSVHDTNASISTNEDGEVVFSGFSKGEKCVLYFVGPPVPAAQYIANLYTEGIASNLDTATVNGVTYNLAPIFDNDDDANSSGGLMNDRRDDSNGGNTATDPNGGNIRYYGANPNNYVWLGDTYIQNNQEVKKLWRIIGVFNGRLKLILEKATNGDGGGLVYDVSTSNENSGKGINQWGPSTYANGDLYEGADLMKLLNQDASGNDYTGINGSYLWNKSTGTVYVNNGSTASVDFTRYGLSNDEKRIIDVATWYLGATDSYYELPYVDVQYKNERQSTILGKHNCSGIRCTDTVIRLATWEGKVGLMYASDYGYASDLKNCTYVLSDYYTSGCALSNWLFLKNTYSSQITISPNAYSDSADTILVVRTNGSMSSHQGTKGCYVRPTIYLKSDVLIDINGKDGSAAHPYELISTQGNTFNITYNSDGGSACSPSVKTITYGSNYDTTCSPTKNSYTFQGWYTGSNCSGTRIYNSTVFTLNNDQTLYACYRAESQCFVAGTKVNTITGYKNIEDVQVGDMVYAIDVDTNDVGLKEVTGTIISKTTELYKIYVGDDIIEATPRHEFYVVDKGWVRASKLVEGDELLSNNTIRRKITKILHKTDLPETLTYNLTIEGYHTYLVTDGNYLVHNSVIKK